MAQTSSPTTLGTSTNPSTDGKILNTGVNGNQIKGTNYLSTYFF